MFDVAVFVFRAQDLVEDILVNSILAWNPLWTNVKRCLKAQRMAVEYWPDLFTFAVAYETTSSISSDGGKQLIRIKRRRIVVRKNLDFILSMK